MPTFSTLTNLLVLDSHMSLTQYTVYGRMQWILVYADHSCCVQHLYVFNEKEVASDLLTFMDSFYGKYPQYVQQDLYIFGESYGVMLLLCLDGGF